MRRGTTISNSNSSGTLQRRQNTARSKRSTSNSSLSSGTRVIPHVRWERPPAADLRATSIPIINSTLGDTIGTRQGGPATDMMMRAMMVAALSKVSGVVIDGGRNAARGIVSAVVRAVGGRKTTAMCGLNTRSPPASTGDAARRSAPHAPPAAAGAADGTLDGRRAADDGDAMSPGLAGLGKTLIAGKPRNAARDARVLRRTGGGAHVFHLHHTLSRGRPEVQLTISAASDSIGNVMSSMFDPSPHRGDRRLGSVGHAQRAWRRGFAANSSTNSRRWLQMCDSLRAAATPPSSISPSRRATTVTWPRSSPRSLSMGDVGRHCVARCLVRWPPFRPKVRPWVRDAGAIEVGCSGRWEPAHEPGSHIEGRLGPRPPRAGKSERPRLPRRVGPAAFTP